MAERVAVGLLDRVPVEARMWAKMSGERDVGGDLAQVAVVPGRLGAVEHAGRVGASPYQPTPNPSPFVVVAPSRECWLWSISEWSGLTSSSSSNTGEPE